VTAPDHPRKSRGHRPRPRVAALAAALAAAATAGACGPPPPQPAPRTLDLRVLVIATGDRTEDPGHELMARTLDQFGVPYDVLDSSTTDLTDATLSSGARGRYNGIVLTQADLYVEGAPGGGFTGEEWRRLHAYERTFGVREAVVSGFPTTDPARDLDYGMVEVGADLATEARWVEPAGTGRLFGYVNTANTLDVPEYSMWGRPRPSGPGQSEDGDLQAAATTPQVTPLLVDDAAPDRVLVSELEYPDGRRVLLSTVGNAWYHLHSNVLAYQLLDYATGGLFIGGRFVSLSTHTDDMFLADDLWDPVANRTDPLRSYRMTAADLDAALAGQEAFRAAHPLASTWRLQFPFNGIGADASGADPLTTRAQAVRDRVGWINHTYAALQMDRLCPDPDAPQLPECPVTDYWTAYGEVATNRLAWLWLGLPGYAEGLEYLLSDSHAGLHDRRGTEEDPSDDVPFPDGLNPNFFQAAQDQGVRYVASDSSRPNQDRERRVPGFDVIVLPRYPTNVYVNATTPAENTDEHNFIHHDRYVEQGIDPCTVPGALCTPRTYEELLDAEARTAVEHMLSGRAWPHYFHQSNLRDYGGGRSLQLDWMNAVMDRYERLFTLPVRTPLAHELGPAARDRIVAAERNVRGWVDVATGRVTLQADGEARPLVTGIAGGERYGGQSVAQVAVGTAPVTRERDAGG
jgi:hypothetical protein